MNDDTDEWRTDDQASPHRWSRATPIPGGDERICRLCGTVERREPMLVWYEGREVMAVRHSYPVRSPRPCGGTN
jgi:hypothetical protein